jgi:hypothetical protein
MKDLSTIALICYLDGKLPPKWHLHRHDSIPGYLLLYKRRERDYLGVPFTLGQDEGIDAQKILHAAWGLEEQGE